MEFIMEEYVEKIENQTTKDYITPFRSCLTTSLEKEFLLLTEALSQFLSPPRLQPARQIPGDGPFTHRSNTGTIPSSQFNWLSIMNRTAQCSSEVYQL